MRSPIIAILCAASIMSSSHDAHAYAKQGVYFLSEIGATRDIGTNGRLIPRNGNTLTSFSRHGSNDRWTGYRMGMGYQYAFNDALAMSLESTYGDYGYRGYRIDGGLTSVVGGSATALNATNSEMRVKFTGVDLLLGVSRSWKDSGLSIKAGAQRNVADMEDRDLFAIGPQSGALSNKNYYRARYDTKAKLALGYHYSLKDRVELTLAWSRLIGSKMENLYTTKNVLASGNVYMGRPSTTALIGTFMAGLHFYF